MRFPPFLGPFFVLSFYSDISVNSATMLSVLKLGSLRNHNGDAEDNVDQKRNLYFTCESRNTLKLFTLLISVKAITKLNLGHIDKSENKFKI